MYVILRPTDDSAESFGEVARFSALADAQAAAQPGDRIERQDGSRSEVVEG